jgi:hypothetical protein
MDQGWFGLGTDSNLPAYPGLTMDTDKLGNCNPYISPVLPETEGVYACQADGVPGLTAIISDTAHVMVIAPPGQPYIKQAKPTDTLDVLEVVGVVLDCKTTGAKLATDQNGKMILANLLEPVHKTPKSETVSTMRMRPTENLNLTCSAFSDVFIEPRLKTMWCLHVRLKTLLVEVR